MDQAEIILAFLKSQKVGVVATVSEGALPEAAIVHYAISDNLEIIIETRKDTRKYKNIKENSRVAFVVSDNEYITVQFEGEASDISEEELDKYKETYFAANPEPKRWEPTGQEVFIKISPKWIRYSNLIQEPREVFEATF